MPAVHRTALLARFLHGFSIRAPIMHTASSTGCSEAARKSLAKPASGLWHVVAFLFVCLVAMEIASFCPVVGQIGFYLDDWATLSFLHFGPQGFFERLAHYFFEDASVVIRPIEAPFFAVLYSLFTTHPLGYHLINGVLEVACACLLYGLLKDYSGNRTLSFLAAFALLLYPIHDVTHYWMLASSVTFSLALSLGSMWLTVKGAASGERFCLRLAYLLYALSIFNYESFLPLCAMNWLLALLVLRRHLSSRQAIVKASILTLPFFLCIGGLWGWQRIIVPSMGVKALLHPVSFDVSWMAHTIWQGLRISSPFYNFPFFLSKIQEIFAQGLFEKDWIFFALGCVAAAAGTVGAVSGVSVRDRSRGALEFVFLGIVLMVVSYTIFALNPEYDPKLDTIINRVNYGSAVGMGMVLAGLAGLVLKLVECLTSGKAGMRAQTACLLALVLPFAAFCLLANRAMAQPWIISWVTQKNIAALVKRAAPLLSDNDSLILVNCPRYVSYSPVFDGVWDFQSMVRLTLNNQGLNADSVSERMTVSAQGVEDISAGYSCGVYPYKGMFLLVPQEGGLEAVASGQQFIDAIESKGLGFGLDPAIIGKWRRQLSASAAN